MESQVLIKCRQSDLELVQKAVQEAKQIYLDTLKADVQVLIDNEYMPASRYPLSLIVVVLNYFGLTFLDKCGRNRGFYYGWQD